MELTQARALELFSYQDGSLIWKVTNSNRAKAGTVAGTTRKDGYQKIRIGGKPNYLHRIVFLMHFGSVPAVIDHIDGDPGNNRIENLRAADMRLNQGNKRGEKRGDTPKGVDWKPRIQKWQARLSIKGKQVYLGVYATKEEAHAAYMKAAHAYFGDFARAT